MQELLPPASDDVLGDVDADDVAGALAALLLDVLDDGAHELAVRRGDDGERDGDGELVPPLAEGGGVLRVELDVERLERGRPGDAGVGEGAEGGLVEASDEHDRVHPGRERDVGVVDGELVADPLVVTVDAEHQEEDERHGQDGDPGAGEELGDEDDDEHGRGHREAEAVDDARALHAAPLGGVGLGREVAGPVPDHAELAEVEGDEHAHDVELDQLGDLGVEREDQDDGGDGEQDDAVAERQTVAAGVELAGQVAVAGQDRAEDGEAVEGGVRGEDQDHARAGDGEVEQRLGVAVEGLRELGDDGRLVVALADGLAVEQQLVGGVLDVADVHGVGEQDDAHQHRDGDGAQEQERRGGVLALRLAEGGHAVADRLDAGEGGAAGREGTRQQERHRQSGERRVVGRLGGDVVRRALRLRQVAEEVPDEPPGGHEADRDHEQVGRDGEGGAGLLRAAQVQRHEQQDEDRRGERLVADEPRDGRGGVLHARGDRHGDREDVVDQQGARHRHAGLRPEVRRGDLVVAAAARVGVDVLAVGGDDREHHEDDGDADLPVERVGGDAAHGERQEDLVRGVGDGRQRVAREHGQGDALRQQRLPQLGTAQLPSDDGPLDGLDHAHERRW